MIKPLWIVVANASLARCLEWTKAGEPMVPLTTLEHPESRLHAEALKTAQPERAMKDDAGRVSFVPRTEPKDRERTEFAREVAKYLQAGAATNRYRGVVLLASNPFLGELLAQLDDGVRRWVTETHAIDLTSFGLSELEARVREQLQR